MCQPSKPVSVAVLHGAPKRRRQRAGVVMCKYCSRELYECQMLHASSRHAAVENEKNLIGLPTHTVDHWRLNGRSGCTVSQQTSTSSTSLSFDAQDVLAAIEVYLTISDNGARFRRFLAREWQVQVTQSAVVQQGYLHECQMLPVVCEQSRQTIQTRMNNQSHLSTASNDERNHLARFCPRKSIKHPPF